MPQSHVWFHLNSGIVTIDDTMFTTLLSFSPRCLSYSSTKDLPMKWLSLKLPTRPPSDLRHPDRGVLLRIPGSTQSPPAGSNDVQFYHDGTLSTSLAVLICIIPLENMRCPLFLGQNSGCILIALSPNIHGRIRRHRLRILSHLCDDAHDRERQPTAGGGHASQ